MCIYWYKRYRCGHLYCDHRRTSLSHCPQFDTALRNWHSQTEYQTLETVLGPGETLSPPDKCSEVWAIGQREGTEPEPIRVAREDAIKSRMGSFLGVVERQQDLDEEQHIRLETREHGSPASDSPSRQGNFNPRSATRIGRLGRGMQMGQAPGQEHDQRRQTNTRPEPYPNAYLAFFQILRNLQNHRPLLNVVVIEAPGLGCGRHNEAECLVGHTGNGRLLCPWLVAVRLQETTDELSASAFDGEVSSSDTREEASRVLRDMTCRGGAYLDVEHPERGQFIRCGLVYKELSQDSRVAAVDQDEAEVPPGAIEESSKAMSALTLARTPEVQPPQDQITVEDPGQPSSQHMSHTDAAHALVPVDWQHESISVEPLATGHREQTGLTVGLIPDPQYGSLQRRIPMCPVLSNGIRVSRWGEWGAAGRLRMQRDPVQQYEVPVLARSGPVSNNFPQNGFRNSRPASRIPRRNGPTAVSRQYRASTATINVTSPTAANANNGNDLVGGMSSSSQGPMHFITNFDALYYTPSWANEGMIGAPTLPNHQTSMQHMGTPSSRRQTMQFQGLMQPQPGLQPNLPLYESQAQNQPQALMGHEYGFVPSTSNTYQDPFGAAPQPYLQNRGIDTTTRQALSPGVPMISGRPRMLPLLSHETPPMPVMPPRGSAQGHILPPEHYVFIGGQWQTSFPPQMYETTQNISAGDERHPARQRGRKNRRGSTRISGSPPSRHVNQLQSQGTQDQSEGSRPLQLDGIADVAPVAPSVSGCVPIFRAPSSQGLENGCTDDCQNAAGNRKVEPSPHDIGSSHVLKAGTSPAAGNVLSQDVSAVRSSIVVPSSEVSSYTPAENRNVALSEQLDPNTASAEETFQTMAKN